jgi:hypothetical protein
VKVRAEAITAKARNSHYPAFKCVKGRIYDVVPAHLSDRTPGKSRRSIVSLLGIPDFSALTVVLFPRKDSAWFPDIIVGAAVIKFRDYCGALLYIKI